MTVPALRIDSLMLDYGDRPVLTNLQLTVEPGRWLAVLGANGSGKSTLLRAIAGHHRPRSGRILVDGVDIHAQPGMVAMPGHASHGEDLPDFLTLDECLEIYAQAHGLREVPPASTALKEKLGLSPFSAVRVRDISLGTRQKLALVIALMRSPRLLLLDEAFNGLDFASALTLRTHLREQVRSRGLTILLATHALHLVVKCCDEWIALEDGRLAKHRLIAEQPATDPLGELERELAGQP